VRQQQARKVSISPTFLANGINLSVNDMIFTAYSCSICWITQLWDAIIIV